MMSLHRKIFYVSEKKEKCFLFLNKYQYDKNIFEREWIVSSTY